MSKLSSSRKLAAGRKQAYGLSAPDSDRRNSGDDGMAYDSESLIWRRLSATTATGS